MSNEAMIYSPTIAERFWRRCGYVYHLGEDPPNSETAVGWMRTDSRIHFGFWDRLRLLVSGRLAISTIAYTDTPSPDKVGTRFDWRIVAPGSDW